MNIMTLIQVILLFVLLIFELCKKQFEFELTQVVQTDKGPVQGIILSTVLNHVRYSAFKGIPYAKPPVGSLRFKPPQDIHSWEFTRKSTNEGEICIQVEWESGHVMGSEDCLFLNIYTPMTNFENENAALKAVLIWIHGGMFLRGSGNQESLGPDFLIEAGVVVVTMNYRLGVLGFLALNHSDVLGNVGLKDQNLALRWVKRNIKIFGGDPNKITLGGHSAGSASVDYHIVSDSSKGLFQRSISMSGSLLSSWAFITPKNAKKQGYSLGVLLNKGKNITDSNELLEILRNAAATDLVLNSSYLSMNLDFLPSLENTHIALDQEKFLTECSMDKLKTGNYNQHPHMMGFVSDELLAIFSCTQTEQSYVKKFALSYVQGLEQFSSFISKNIKKQFYQNISKELLQTIILLISDAFFVSAINVKEQVMSNTSNQPIYYYRNSFDTKNESFHQLVLNRTILNGTSHIDDLYYLFYADFMKNIPMNPDSPLSIIRNRMVRLWTNFMKYGNPTPEGTNDELLNITWPDARSTGSRLEISNNLSLNKTQPISEYLPILNTHLSHQLSIPNSCISYKT